MCTSLLSPTIIARQLLMLITDTHPGGELSLFGALDASGSKLLLEARFGDRVARCDSTPVDLALSLEHFSEVRLQRAVKVLTGKLPSDPPIDLAARPELLATTSYLGRHVVEGIS